MATGLLIRDFSKQYRELRYADSGSIALSEIEKNAYRASLTLEVTHLDAPRYGNLKTLPPNTHYGYCTLFRGSTVIDSIAIKYPKFRIFDITNQAIWNYHQLTENQVLGASTVVLSVNTAARSLWQVLGEGVGDLFQFLVGVSYEEVGEEPPEWVFRIFSDDSASPDQLPNSFDAYRAFPIASPFPDIVKFKADVPCSFLWRLELWYLVNPAVYIVDNPTDSGDQTDGEDEYPEPEQSEPENFPDSDPIPNGADPRDFAGGALAPFGSTNFQVSWKAYGDPQNSTSTGVQVPLTFQLEGQWPESAVTFGCAATATTGPAGTFCVQPQIFLNGEMVWTESVSVPPDWVIDVRVFRFQN